ncbi:diguanylate cyclase [Enterovibrio coralii]|uniref:diguanylate cyclase n=1 Tax=Enterovibrio coralii TaxID=294935 RepID=A0A135I2P9_9GAMM|nr:diguanylate cyclase [Enterovibrio coralii]KXF79712.1 hypothetical protein ATN88_12335 [Enterovibrio coralii]
MFFKRQRIGIVAATMLVLLTVSGWASANHSGEEGAQKVLYINSYHQGYSWSDDIEKGFIEALHQSGLNVELSQEYLDSQRFPNADGFLHIRQLFDKKYKDYHPDLVFTSDNNAFHFALDNRDTFFPDTPIVFVGYNNFKPSIIEGVGDVTGLNEAIELVPTIRLGLDVFPDTTRLAFLVSSQNKSDSAHREKVISDLVPYFSKQENLPITLLDNVTVEQATNQMNNLESTTLLFVFGRITDKGPDRNLSPAESTEMLAHGIEQPIFGAWSFQLGKGIVGGDLLTGTTQGKVGGEMAVKILTGTPVSDIPIKMRTPHQVTFDAKVMSQVNIDKTKIPADAVIINEEVSIWVEYFWPIVAVICLVIGEGFLVLKLFVTKRQKEKAVLELEETNDTLEEKVLERTKSLRQAKKELEVLTETDALTEIHNRRFFEKQLNIELSRAYRHQSPLSLIIIDIDYFKKFNDTYGHVAGDECLKRVASIIETQCRRMADVAARYGGEEFVILLPDTDSEGAVIVSEQLQQDIARAQIFHENSEVDIFLTLSLGVITYQNADELISGEKLLSLADEHLYTAKKQGRNCYVSGVYPEPLNEDIDSIHGARG